MTAEPNLQITAYHNGHLPGLEIPIVPASSRREWMKFWDEQAYRCLPLTMANQVGWFLLNPVGFVAEWQGEAEDSPITIDFDETLTEAQSKVVGAYFGFGILTWGMPYVFRTSPGYNLLVRGPANWLKDGIQALEGMVESDWIDATFTMNWKFTRSHYPVRFEKGEPFCMITPIKRGEVEQFEPNIEPIENNVVLHEDYTHWKHKRQKAVEDSKWRKRIAAAMRKPHIRKYDLSYLRGQTASGRFKFPEHQTRLMLKPFDNHWQHAPVREPDPSGESDG